ncbi:MAG: type II toxin-antitoxin system RelE/ParE family toxin [Deltaproteobacteria bacterium]|nr:type II toxin-antitoxin system RelE/ParE family toxin [Deltaproteobacteria bacterium]
MLKLVISPEATADLDDIWSYIAEDNPEMATLFLSSILAECRLLSDSPYIGRERDDIQREGVRSIPFRNYIILYQVKKDSVEILHVFHGRRDYPRLFDS